MAKTVLIVEDERAIVEILKFNLKREGYETLEALDGQTGLQLAQTEDPDLILLDVMLPKMNGFDICKTLRAENRTTPIIMLTAREEEMDKVFGLETGADDYMTKPFGVLELAARIRLQLRKRAPKEAAKDVLAAGQLKMSPKTREAWFRERLLELTYKEYELLLYLLENQARVVSREELLNNIWGYEYDGESRTLDMHIRTLRQKLGEEGGDYIKTIRGVGYRFRVTTSPENEG